MFIPNDFDLLNFGLLFLCIEIILKHGITSRILATIQNYVK